MIIDFPTALYNSVLPTVDDPGSVTYIVSSTDPPRATDPTAEIPIAEQLRPLPDKIFTRKEFRDALGDFVFSVSEATVTDIGSNKKQFEVGQLLNFGEFVDVEGLTVTEVPTLVDLQQNTNILELSDFGLSEAEITALTNQAELKFNELIEELNAVKTAINDNEAQIRENQKSINEVNKTIKAARVVLDVPGTVSHDIIDKLVESAEELIEERDALITETNELNVLAKAKYQELLDTRELVR
jgi:uncharacterized protein YeeX (DUF496 family)